MKNNSSSRIVLGLFALLFINTDVNAQRILPNFVIHHQEGNNTCWAACNRMMMTYYNVIKEEENVRKEQDIRRLAFNTSDSDPAPDRTNELKPTADLLARLLITTGNTYGSGTLSQNAVAYLIDNGGPIVAAASRRRDDTEIAGHMYVIAGYQGSGANMTLLLADPNDPDNINTYYDKNYSDFVNEYELSANITEQWSGYIYPTYPPPAPKQIVVDKIAVPTKTITAAVNRTESGSSTPWEIIHVFDTATYEERVTIDSTKFHIDIISTPWLPNPTIKSSRALNVLGAQGISISGININGDNAIYNTGTLSLMHLNVNAPSGYAVHNTGEFYIDYRDSKTTVSSTSSDAIYNTGEVYILNGIVSAAAGYAAIYNNSGILAIMGDTELKTASGINGNAIYNSGINGSLALGSNPTITGRITGFRAGRMGVSISGSYVFAPGNKKYVLAPYNLRNGDVVVVDGAKFIDNFELTDTYFTLVANGNHLFAIASPIVEISVGKIDAQFETIPDALYPYEPGQVVTIIDRESYGEQVTIDSAMSGITIRGTKNPVYVPRPKIKYFLKERNVAPQNYAGFNMLNGEPEIIGGVIEENSALRVLGARGTLIDGIDIEGETAVYNTGAVTVRNGTVSAASGCAIYNTGLIEIANAAVSASDVSGYAIYNDGGDGELVLGGSVDITGRIAGFGAGKVSVYTYGDYAFSPGNRKYVLAIDNLKHGDVAVAGGADFINNFELTDTGFVLAANGDDLVAISLAPPVAIDAATIPAASSARAIPAVNPAGEAAVIAPVNALTGEFTAGPNPMSKKSGIVNFFRQGKRVASCELRIYDVYGNIIKKIKINDNALGEMSRRQVGTWDLTDKNGRPVPEGTYLVRGAVRTSDRKSEKVSVILGVR